MKLSDYKRKSDEYTSKASDIIRQMLLGAIGLVWLFKETKNGVSQIDQFLIYPLVAVSLGLICDLLQYVVAGKIWKRFFVAQERIYKNTPTPDPTISAPRRYNRIIYFFYWAKIILMVATYFLILFYLLNEIALTE